jgi:hypothetical protein
VVTAAFGRSGGGGGGSGCGSVNVLQCSPKTISLAGRKKCVHVGAADSDAVVIALGRWCVLQWAVHHRRGMTSGMIDALIHEAMSTFFAITLRIHGCSRHSLSPALEFGSFVPVISSSACA